MKELREASQRALDVMRTFSRAREQRVRQLLGIPTEEGFKTASMRMVTRAECECRGTGVIQELVSPPGGKGCWSLEMRECQCVRYERVDVKA